MSEPCRVMYLNHAAKPSGAEFALMRLLSAVDRTKVWPVMVFGEDGPAVQAMREIDVETHVLPLSSRVREVRKDTLGAGAWMHAGRLAMVAAYAARVGAFAREHRIRIIHTNTIKAHVYGALASRFARAPLVWHIRDFVNESYFPAATVKAFRFMARHAPKHVIAVSNSVMEQLRMHDGGKRSTVVYDGLSDRELEPRANGPEPLHSPVRIGIVGRLAKWKGQHIFLQAAARVVAAGHEAEFVIIGAPLFGEDEYEEGLRRQAAPLAPRVRFAGFTKDIPKAMAALDIVVHASITGEPFGQVITEAMAVGKPVIATRGGGVPEIITHGENGLLTPMGDPAALANEIISLIQDPEKARRIGGAGYHHVRDTFTARQGARQVERIYGRIIKG